MGSNPILIRASIDTRRINVLVILNLNGDYQVSEFTKYRRTNIAEMRPFILGEDMSKISVSDTDSPESDMGMVARNPSNHLDQWYVARQYFNDNFETA